MKEAACKKIGIMGGTFDPVHFGHLRAADEARQALGLSEVVFIPCGCPPHKQGLVSSSEDRYNMTLLATVDCPYFSVSRIELESEGYSYTLKTLQKMKTDGKYVEAELFFITGLDAVLDIMSWKEPREIIKLCRFVAVSRFGYSKSGIERLPLEFQNAIIPLEIPLLAISSTELRQRIAQGRSIRYLVPASVENYIKKKGLYVR